MDNVRSINKKSVLALIFIVTFFLVMYLNSGFSEKEAAYTKGIVLGRTGGTRGTKYLQFSYVVNKKTYIKDYSLDFCDECKDHCCAIGDTLIIRYKILDPSKCRLVHELPKGAVLTTP